MYWQFPIRLHPWVRNYIKMNSDSQKENPWKKIFARWEATRPEPKSYDETDSGAVSGQSQNVENDPFRSAAVRLAGLAEEIVDLLERTPITQEVKNAARKSFKEEPIPGINLWKSPDFFIQISVQCEEIKDEIGGEEKFRTVTINQFSDIPNIAKRLGVNTSTELFIRLHTDESTYDQYRAMAQLGDRTAELVGTLYLFDKKGNYRKVACIPKKFEDKREDISDYPTLGSFSFVYVRSEMTPGDFEIAGKALVILKEKLQLLQNIK